MTARTNDPARLIARALAAQPAGRQLDLQVMVVPAIRSLPEPDPFVILVGGPGQAATVDALAVWNAVAAQPMPKPKAAAPAIRWPDED